MNKFTTKIFELKEEALLKKHKLDQLFAKEMYEWEQEFTKQEDAGGGYLEQPFPEPFEFVDEDYIIHEKPLRIRTEDISMYGEDKDGNTFLIDKNTGVTNFIKESVELLDKICEVQ